MSNNAVEAYNKGLKPKSKWLKSDILDEIQKYRPDLYEAAKKIRTKVLKAYLLEEKEWHHSSKFYNRIGFYGINEDYLENVDYDNFKLLMNEFEEKESVQEEYRCICRYLEWSGTRNHPKATEVEAEGVIKGNWFYLPNGKKKSINANGFEIIERIQESDEIEEEEETEEWY